MRITVSDDFRKPVNIMPTPTIDIAGPVAGIDTHTDTHTVAIVTETGKQALPDLGCVAGMKGRGQ